MRKNRKNRRLLMDAPVEVAVSSGLWGFFTRRRKFQGKVRNASMQGLQLHVDRPIPDNAVVRVWIQIDSGTTIRTLKLLGDVVWSEPGDGPGSLLIGIRLRDKPREPMRLWEDTMLEEVRHFGGSDVRY